MLKPHVLDNEIHEYLSAIEEAGYRWTLHGVACESVVLTIAKADTNEASLEFEDSRGIGLSWPLYQACLKLGLISKEAT